MTILTLRTCVRWSQPRKPKSDWASGLAVSSTGRLEQAWHKALPRLHGAAQFISFRGAALDVFLGPPGTVTWSTGSALYHAEGRKPRHMPLPLAIGDTGRRPCRLSHRVLQECRVGELVFPFLWNLWLRILLNMPLLWRPADLLSYVPTKIRASAYGCLLASCTALHYYKFPVVRNFGATSKKMLSYDAEGVIHEIKKKSRTAISEIIMGQENLKQLLVFAGPLSDNRTHPAFAYLWEIV